MQLRALVLLSLLIGFHPIISAETLDTGKPIPQSELRNLLIAGRSVFLAHLNDTRMVYETRTADGSGEKVFVCEYLKRGPRESLAVSSREGDVISRIVTDGAYVLYLKPGGAAEDGTARRAHAQRKYLEGRVLGEEWGPGALTGCPEGADVDAALASAAVSIDSEAKKIEGLWCYRVVSSAEREGEKFNCTFWMSIERLCFPIRIEVRDTEGRLVQSCETTDFHQPAEGLWLPQLATWREYSTDEGGTREIARRAYRLISKETCSAPLEEEQFNTSTDVLPEGTLLEDFVEEQEYAVGEGSVSEGRIEAIAREIRSSLLSGRKSPAGDRALFSEQGVSGASGESHRLGWVLLLMCGTGLCVGAWILARHRMRRVAIPLVLMLTASGGVAHADLESWKSCSGPVCLKLIAAIEGQDIRFAGLRDEVMPDSRGEISLQSLAEVAGSHGFHAEVLRVMSDDLELCSVPLVWRRSRNDFVVLLGLGKGKGVGLIEPPHSRRPMTPEGLKAREHFDLAAISRSPFAVDMDRAQLPDLDPEVRKERSGKPGAYGGLEIEQQDWYFGLVGLREKRSHVFEFMNRGQSPVSLTGVRSTCPCFRVQVLDKTITPGQKGRIQVDMDATGLQGPVHKSVFGFVEREGVSDREVFVLRIHGEVSSRRQCVVIPSTLFLPDMLPGETMQREVTVARLGYEPLQLERFVAKSPHLRGLIPEVTDDASQRARVELTVTAPIQSGPFEAEGVFETDHPMFREAAVRARGNVVSDITADPPAVFLGMVDRESDLKRVIGISSRSGRPFSIESVRITAPFLKAEIGARHADGGASREIAVGRVEPLPPGLLKGEIIVKIMSSNGEEEMSIPFAGLVARVTL